MDSMSNDIKDVATQAKEQLDSLTDMLHNRNVSNSNINVNAGGIGLWIAVTCCIIMFIILLSSLCIGMLAYTQMEDQISNVKSMQNRYQDYQNVIYQKVPELRKLMKRSK